MIRLLADENFNAALVRALENRLPADALTTVQALGLRGAADDDLLRYATERDLVLISHDRQTLPAIAYARIARGEPFPGVIIAALLALAGRREDFEGQVRYLPLTS